jgi:hypothetical protein
MPYVNKTIGTVIEIQVDVVDADGEALSLSGSDLTFTAVSKGGDVVIVKTDVDGITLDAVVGRCLITIDEEDTSLLLRPVNLIWDLMVEDVLGDTRRVAKGKIALSLPASGLIVA